jgi:hypothetical protein
MHPPKLHLNEHLSPKLAVQLRQNGFDITSSQEAGILSEPDDVQLEFAVSQQRAIVSFNIRDFEELHLKYLSAQKEHWGIILSSRVPMSVVFHRTLRLLTSVSAEELKCQIRWLNEFQ